MQKVAYVQGGLSAPASSGGTVVSAGQSATNNAFGSWYEVVAAAPMDANFIAINAFSGAVPFPNKDMRLHLNVGVGVSGAERIVTEGYSFYPAGNNTTETHPIPADIKRGDRVAIQVAGPVDNARSEMTAHLIMVGGVACPRVVDSAYLSSGNANADGAPFTMPSADNVWSPWQELTQSLLDDGDEIIFRCVAPAKPGGVTHESWLMQLGVGVNGAETPICDPVLNIMRSYDTWNGEVSVSAQVRKGQRLALRIMSDSISAFATPYSGVVMWTVLARR